MNTVLLRLNVQGNQLGTLLKCISCFIRSGWSWIVCISNKPTGGDVGAADSQIILEVAIVEECLLNFSTT